MILTLVEKVFHHPLIQQRIRLSLISYPRLRKKLDTFPKIIALIGRWQQLPQEQERVLVNIKKYKDFLNLCDDDGNVTYIDWENDV